MKRKVIQIFSEKTNKGDIKLTDILEPDLGWTTNYDDPSTGYKEIVYLGKCQEDGDMFAGYSTHGKIIIFKGHLNAGTY